jgi:hemerythrin-like domain-containing protein
LQSSPAPPATPPSLEPILERLEALEKLLADSQKATIGQLEQLEENLNRLLELEDELGLSEIRERLSLVEAGQVEIADGLHSISRNLSVLTVVIALLVAAAAFSLGVLL